MLFFSNCWCDPFNWLIGIAIVSLILLDAFILAEVLGIKSKLKSQWSLFVLIAGFSSVMGIFWDSFTKMESLGRIFVVVILLGLPIFRLLLTWIQPKQDGDPEFVYRNVLWLFAVPCAFFELCILACFLFPPW